MLKLLKAWGFYLENCNRAYRRISNSLLLHDYEQRRKTSMLSDLETSTLPLIVLVAGFQEMMVLVLARLLLSSYLIHNVCEADVQYN